MDLDNLETPMAMTRQEYYAQQNIPNNEVSANLNGQSLNGSSIEKLAKLLVAISDQDLEWQKDAVCKGSDPAKFYPGVGQSIGPARKICNECPVEVECRDYALENLEYGVWGGTSERQRVKIRRSRKKS